MQRNQRAVSASFICYSICNLVALGHFFLYPRLQAIASKSYHTMPLMYYVFFVFSLCVLLLLCRTYLLAVCTSQSKKVMPSTIAFVLLGIWFFWSFLLGKPFVITLLLWLESIFHLVVTLIACARIRHNTNVDTGC